MKKINLKGISEVLSDKELKNVMGGSSMYCDHTACDGEHSCIDYHGRAGKCQWQGYPNSRYCGCAH